MSQENKIMDCNSEELYLRVGINDCEMVIGLPDAGKQSALQADTKAFVYEWMQYINAPIPPESVWKKSSVEVVSKSTLDREDQLRKTLEWILHHPDINDAIYVRVREVLGSGVTAPF